MEISELLRQDFTLRDGLTGADVLALEEVRGTLEALTAKWAKGGDGIAELEREAQRRALELFQTTHDLQAWVVLVEVLVQTGSAGVLLALQLVDKGLGPAWDGVQSAAEQALEPGKATLRLGRHVDGLLGRLYEYLSYLQERSPERLERAVEGDKDTWGILLQAVEHSLSERKLSGANWESLRDVLQKNMARRERARLQAPRASIVELTAVIEATSATDSNSRNSRPASSDGNVMSTTDAEKTTESSSGPSLEGSDHATLRVSREFVELRRRLEAFQILLTRKDFEKAALVAGELSEGLGRCDITALFPDLFAGLFQGQVDYATELEPYSVRGDGMRERSLKQLYRTALDRFIGENPGSGHHGR